MSKISVVIPVFNEEKSVEQLILRVMQTSFGNHEKELILIDDGSTDQTVPLALQQKEKYPGIRIISLSRNFGHQMAITAGLELATGDAVVIMDGDLQDPPEMIKNFIEQWMNGYQVVYGIRSKRKGESYFKKISAKVFYRILSSLSDIKIPIDAGDFKLLDRKVVEAIRQMKESNRYVRGLISWAGFKNLGIPYDRDIRYAGKSKFTIWKMIRFSVDGILSFSIKPLYISILTGITFSIISFLWFCFVIINYFLGFRETVTGWSSIIAAILLIGGLNLMFMGIIGLYVGRIFRESQKRPLYIIDKEYF